MKTQHLVLSAMFIALVAISSMVVLPIGPVPITFQTGVVILTGVLLGSKNGSITITGYILLGLVGIPVFAGGHGGIQAVVSPTFGFVLGFIPLAFFSGIKNKSENSFVQSCVYTLTGVIILFITGLLYFYFVMNVVIQSSVGVMNALALTVIPFILKDILLTIVTVAFTKTLLRRGIRVSS